ncbi:transcription initiation factor TFIID subunit 4-like [Molothrus ater]|uniref:transcription initiation factor TFIID subunit 4-like n=1 Tax=Molothrus ater TaxID=84834 RepID=UPI0023E779FE|nr:transcription initiation factor TFIID subunit 4-like [Molothrus ater]
MAAGTPGGLRGMPGSPLRALGRPLAAGRAGAAPQVPPPLPRRALPRPRLRLPLAPRGGGHVRGSPRAAARAPSPPRLLLPPLSDPRPPAALNREAEPAGPRPRRSHWRLHNAGGKLATPLAVARRGPAGVWLSLFVTGVRGACARMRDHVRLCRRCACATVLSVTLRLCLCPRARTGPVPLCPFVHACLSVHVPPVSLRGHPCPCTPLISGQPPCCGRGRVPPRGRGSVPAVPRCPPCLGARRASVPAVPRCPPRLPAPLAGRCPRCWIRAAAALPALPALLLPSRPGALRSPRCLRRAPPRSRAPRLSGLRGHASLKRCGTGGEAVLELPDSLSPEDAIRASATGHCWAQTAPKMSARACGAQLDRAQQAPGGPVGRGRSLSRNAVLQLPQPRLAELELLCN